ncbi:MAG: PqqD family protein [Rhodospirillales bacterium]|nr:PqqD family protein [Rhodospirillales bacterium]MDH3790331.1 PqqD family protein [Rhodospirillales bacterium]MDH3912390.1 PqqD family protein [Rhodospirillales bacterium]MDH3917973.1 PqqD family protein [Rhodospirillales bacterium]MDH3967685.1 PqqD family protein [Rhodospirillales bacterium]
MTDRLLLEFEGLSQRIVLLDCREVYACFPEVFRGWKIREAGATAQPPILTLEHSTEGYTLETPWLAKPLVRHDKIDALCGFIAEFVRAYVNDDQRLLCLHGAAAEFTGRLVIFPNRYRAGKSVLSACLAAAEVRLFADDVLPIGGPDDHGMAPGIVPRLRLPLPDNLAPATRDFLEARRGPSGKRYLYLDLTATELASYGTLAPIGGFVLLEREAGAELDLAPVDPGEMLRQVIWQNFARETPAPEILRRLERIVGRARCLRLRYDRADEAVALLKESFTSWPAAAEDPQGAVQNAPGPGSSTPVRDVPAGCYLRNPEVTETKVGEEHFLADSKGAAIHNLNPVGSALWQLMIQPKTIDELVDPLHAAFPQIARTQIEQDVRALLKGLIAKRLVLAGPEDIRGRQSAS